MKYTQKKALRWMVAMGLTMTAFSWGSVEAMPTGGEVRSGDAEIKTSGQTMDIDQKTSRVALDWTGFDIAKGETVRFHQNPSDIAINRILGNKASEIYGSLQAGGTVFLLNPQGILFGQGAQVDVGNLIASTAQVDDSFMKGFSAGGDVSLPLGEASKGKVINAGDIKAQGGLVALHAANVENTGSIKNDGGKVSLSAVKNLELAIDTAGKINFETSGETANAHTLNAGTIQADGGYVVMTAKSAGDMLSEVVNNEGIIEAKTASINDKGEILLDGGDHGTVNVGGTLDASGMSEGQSGGVVRIVGENTSVKDGAKLTASGDKDGGLVETSGDVLDVSTKADIEAKGRTGKAGEWLLDPVDVIIGNDTKDYSETEKDNETILTGSSSSGNKKSWIKASDISKMLSDGTNVTVQAVDGANLTNTGNSNITVMSAITKSGDEHKSATLKLQAQRNVVVYAPISAEKGTLNIILHADTDGDQKGMVAIGANINTNGGYFTSGTGKDLTDGTVGTYFGPYDSTNQQPNNGSDKASYHEINTSGGAVNLYGDVALGLDGGTLKINTNGGDVKITGNVDSLNNYRLITEKSEGIDNIVKEYYQNYLCKHGYNNDWDKLSDIERDIIKKRHKSYDENWDNKVKRYYNEKIKTNHESSYSNKEWSALTTDDINAIDLLFENSEDWNAEVKKYYEDYVQITNDSYENQRDDLYEKILATNSWKNSNRESILNRWELAKEAAKEGTAGGVAENNRYLATITTSLENWIIGSKLENYKDKHFLIGGATDEGTSIKKREFKWMTGPEGLNGGTIFYTHTGNKGDGIVASDMYQNWMTNDPDNDSKCIGRANDGQPYVAIKWRDNDQFWSDVDNQKDKIIGFVQEINTKHSNLNVSAGEGSVNIGGNIGKSAMLSDLTIETNREVKIGGGKNIYGNAGEPSSNFSGLVYTDNDVNITGNGGVNVGGRITSSNGKVNITSVGDITTNGIKANNTVKLLTKGKDKKITLRDNIVTDSTAKDAVIIDARNGFLSNEVNNSKETINAGAHWKVYLYSPDGNQFGNLNSYTYALWDGKEVDDDTMGRYIFTIQPKITLTAGDYEKVYGDEVNFAGWKSTVDKWTIDEAVFKQDTIDEKQIQAVSDGFAAKANVKAGGYDIGAAGFEQTAAGQHGYRLETYGKVNVTPRPLDVAVEFTGTYGSKQYTDKVVTVKNLVAGDKVTDVDYTLADSYTSRIGAGAVTRDVGVYENAVQAKSVTFADAEDADNYTITYNNAKLTIKPKEVVLDLTGTGINLDKSNIQVNGAGYAGQLVNGDTLASAPVVTYGIGSRQLGAAYGIDLFVDGVKVNSGDVAGNYRFNYTGVYKLLNVEPPQLDFISTSPRRGTASYDTNTAVPASSVEKVLGLTTAKLPVMKEVNSNITRYGTYQLTVEPDKVTLVQADKNIPVPVNGIHDQYREYTKNLTTNRGAADFRLSYDGCILAIHPAGQAAEKMLEAGDAAHNVDVVSQALHTAFSEMGLELQDIDAVYVCFE